ncbi:hypothetical protein PR048_014458 [Dryococelus australis]|uniref:Uncharacterized protein n=1 Tax=Dryococelus australis TaxID=614101 RepID=A0ABQ9HE89_9NEOP|nr:hypothetical protein PR048_014458 [Dryococelus australis]
MQCHDGNTARLARRSDEALEVCVSVARIALSLLDLGRGVPTGIHPTLNQREILRDHARFAACSRFTRTARRELLANKNFVLVPSVARSESHGLQETQEKKKTTHGQRLRKKYTNPVMYGTLRTTVGFVHFTHPSSSSSRHLLPLQQLTATLLRLTTLSAHYYAHRRTDKRITPLLVWVPTVPAIIVPRRAQLYLIYSMRLAEKVRTPEVFPPSCSTHRPMLRSSLSTSSSHFGAKNLPPHRSTFPKTFLSTILSTEHCWRKKERAIWQLCGKPNRIAFVFIFEIVASRAKDILSRSHSIHYDSRWYSSDDDRAGKTREGTRTPIERERRLSANAARRRSEHGTGAALGLLTVSWSPPPAATHRCYCLLAVPSHFFEFNRRKITTRRADDVLQPHSPQTLSSLSPTGLSSFSMAPPLSGREESWGHARPTDAPWNYGVRRHNIQGSVLFRQFRHQVFQRAAVAKWLDCSPPNKAAQVKSPDRSRILASGNRAGRCLWSAGFFFSLGSPVLPVLEFRRCSILTSFHPHRLSRPCCQQPRNLATKICVTTTFRLCSPFAVTCHFSGALLKIHFPDIPPPPPECKSAGNGKSRENPSIRDIVRHDYHVKKYPGATLVEIEPVSPRLGGEQPSHCTTTAPTAVARYHPAAGKPVTPGWLGPCRRHCKLMNCVAAVNCPWERMWVRPQQSGGDVGLDWCSLRRPAPPTLCGLGIQPRVLSQPLRQGRSCCPPTSTDLWCVRQFKVTYCKASADQFMCGVAQLLSQFVTRSESWCLYTRARDTRVNSKGCTSDKPAGVAAVCPMLYWWPGTRLSVVYCDIVIV